MLLHDLTLWARRSGYFKDYHRPPVVDAENAARQIALHLHALCCQYDHTESCSWYWELEDGGDLWKGSAHRAWLQRARDVIQRNTTRDNQRDPPAFGVRQ